MPTVGVNARALRAITYDAKMLIPKGQSTVPLRVQLKSGKMIFLIRSTCTYCAELQVDTDEVADVVVNFLDISDYLPTEGSVNVEIAGNSGIRIESSAVSLILVPAYSTVEDVGSSDYEWKALENSSIVTALHTLSSTGLDGLYKKSPPVELFGSIAILKYPNIYIQTRAPEIGADIAITQECARYVQSFAPKEYALVSNDTVVFKKYETLLYVPVKIIHKGTTCKDIIPQGGYSLKLDLGGFLSKLSSMRKLGVDRCDITLYESGMSAGITSNLSSINATVGNKGEFLTSLALPMQLVYIVFKLLGDAYCEILYKEGVLCLRTPTLVIVVHALS